MPRPIRIAQFVFLLMLLVTTAVPIVRELTRRPDIWWTPATHPLTLAEAKDRVEVYSGDRLLDGADVRVRLNNFDRVRAEQLRLLLVDAFACGAALMMLLVMLMPRSWPKTS
jgi:hypothetical protein